MNKTREKKIKNLRKGRIWPSIVFLIFSMILAVAAFVLLTSIIIAYFAQERMTTAYNNAAHISGMFYAGSSAEDENRVIGYLERDPVFSDAVYLLDKSGNIVAGFGGATYDLSLQGDMIENKEYRVYADSDAINSIIAPDGAINFDRLVEQILAHIFNMGNYSRYDIVLESPLWIGRDISNDRMVVIKCSIWFCKGDLMLAIIVGGVAVAVMFLPILFLLSNTISNFRNQKHMNKLIYTDTVTGGKNRMHFEHYADKILASRHNNGKLYAVVDVTLMKYRNFCAFYGVKEGEKILEKMDRYFFTRLDRKEYSSYYGSSSFALFLKCDDKESCERRVENMINKLPQYLGYESMIFHAGVYFLEPVQSEDGRKKYMKRSADIADCYNCASAARAYLADEVRTAYLVYNLNMLDEQMWERKVEDKMNRALENEEFKVYIQPKYNPVTEKLQGAEALVRWLNDEDGFISPGRFIPIFEKNGFITKLDDYMISHVAKLQAQWYNEGKNVVPVSVNVSRAHFANPDLAKHICELVDKYNIPHSLIEIELTESAFFDDKAALLNIVKELKASGFDVSMDDFGAGYSSLNSLKDLPLDVLKLDADFFRGTDEEKRGEVVVAEAISLAKKLNMRIVAEGIEKKEQVEFLARQDCDMIQGFYFAKPMPAEEYEARLEENGKAESMA